MRLSELTGRRFGPYAYPIGRAKIDEFVTATGDDPERWTAAAPPGFAAALLFAAAPAFFADPVAAPYTSILLHTDQQFVWHDAIRAGDTEIVGSVDAVRERAGLNLVTFTVDVSTAGGRLVTSTSTFMMSDATPAADVPEEAEPPHDLSGPNERPSLVEIAAPGAELPPLAKSASRADLIRYAAATGDFNPLHWDHDAARAAGVAGIVVHGLLMASWLMQSAARLTMADAPLRDIRLRFRRPLRPAVAARVTGSIVESGDAGSVVKGAVRSDEGDLVTSTATVNG